MSLGQWYMSVTLALSNKFTVHTFPSVIKYGLIFCGTSSNGGKIFTLQKKIVRTMVGAQPRTSCRSLFKQPEILSDPCQYILSLMSFIVNNLAIFQINSSIHY